MTSGTTTTITTTMNRPLARLLILSGALLLLLAATLFAQPARAQGELPLHPAFALLDAEGRNVLSSGEPVSTMRTCGSCHDTAFIAGHSFHADVGLSQYGSPAATGHEWDTSPGLFGRWNPIAYRYLSAPGEARIDLTTAEWIKVFGARHVGGGPATTARNGQALTALTVGDAAPGPETGIIDPETGIMAAWDWGESGVVEMNCFLCHSAQPNNQARIETLQTGDFRWANSATLLGTGLLLQTSEGWRWNGAVFDAEGRPKSEALGIQDPTGVNCGQCHGTVHSDAQTPLTTDVFDPMAWSTYTTGQIVSPQQIARSGLNLANKEMLTRTWDVHAERVVGCTDCHYSLNNPVYYREQSADKPEHLIFDPRRLDLGEYLYRPLHQFAKGQNPGSVPGLENSMRRCESCHSIAATHNWLPYKERHTAEVACETCHIPKLYAPALKAIDWTSLYLDGSPLKTYRGIEGSESAAPDALISGYEPVILPRQSADGTTALAPFNLITAWYWVYGEPARPVPLRDLQAAWLEDERYAPEVLAAFDADGDGALSERELRIDSVEKQAVIAGRLEARGLTKLRIVGEVEAYSINHDVARSEWAIRECRTCHGENSRLEAALPLSSDVPAGVMPTLSKSLTNNSAASGKVYSDQAGRLYFQTTTENDNLYVFGHDRAEWVDTLGTLIFLATLAGASIHGGLRYFFARRRTPRQAELRKVYMYSLYERQWHWLQTLVIFGLLFTGIVIHKPDTFGVFSFPGIVEVHNILGVILLINAALAAFYHLASGEIRQFLPKPAGFFDQAFQQAKYYLRGIFKGAEHPFEKTRQRKMNPLQQVTYLLLLNVLLPLQVISGLLMMGVQQWPEIALRLGGLPFLAPLHTAVAWLLASFIVLHVYLTTTGHKVTTDIKAMITGWDEVEVHPGATTGD